MTDHDDLWKLAAAAIPGPWLRDELTVYALHHHGGYERGKPRMVNRFAARIDDCAGQGGTKEEAEATVAYIAALYPQVTLGLLDAEHRLMRVREALLAYPSFRQGLIQMMEEDSHYGGFVFQTCQKAVLLLDALKALAAPELKGKEDA